MDGNVTQDQIIKFVYGELSFEATAKLYDEIDQSPDQLADLEVYAALKMEIDALSLAPSKRVRENVLEFSQTFDN